MAKPFVLAHASDLHVSTFGDTFHDRARIVKRSARLADGSETTHDICWEEGGWKVLREKGKKTKVQLVDPEGYAHPVPSAGASASENHGTLLDPVERAAAKACRLEARSAATLAQGIPSAGALAVLLEATPKNSNLRFLRSARAILEDQVDAVIVTGDLTDDGSGYELVEETFARFRDAGRLFAIPGNHDLFLFPLAGSGRPRPTHESKRAAWRAFAERLGLPLSETGAWAKSIPEAAAMLVGLDSCARPQRRFFRQNGAIGPAQLEWLKELAKGKEWKAARHRVVAVHHHVVPLPHGVGRRAPTEFGMRLDDAREFARVLNEVNATLVLHGHRHISEARHPAGCNFELLAAPSFTLGCKSGDAPSYWRIELDDHAAHATRVRIPVEAIEQENDPGTDDTDGDGAANGEKEQGEREDGRVLE
jgi:3',5'-cyclic AMP phosphodiesterase CpdA